MAKQASAASSAAGSADRPGRCDGAARRDRALRPAVEAVRDPCDPAARSSANAEFVEAGARENVRSALEAICEQSSVLREMQVSGAIDLVGGLYDVTNGAVEFLPVGS